MNTGTGKGTWEIFAELIAGVRFKLPLVPEAPTAVSAGILLKSKMHSKVVLHCQTIRIRGVAHITVILANLMQILMISQTAGMTISASTLIANKGPTTATIVNLLSPCSGIRFLVTLWLTVVGVHRRVWNFGLAHSHSLKLRWASLIACTIGMRHALNPLVTISSLRSMFLV